MPADSYQAIKNDLASNRLGKRTIVITAADEKYFSFAEDLINSILSKQVGNSQDFDIGFIDLGISDRQKQWLIHHGAVVKKPYTGLSLNTDVSPTAVEWGCVVRPFLREIFPGYHIYVWLDADTWVQDLRGLYLLTHGAVNSDIAAAFQSHRAYKFDVGLELWKAKHFYKGFGLLKGARLLFTKHVNAGVFAIRTDSKLWERWAIHYQSAIYRAKRARTQDQFSLNAAIYIDRLKMKTLPATVNWICDLATPSISGSDLEFYVPDSDEKILIVHLAGYQSKNKIYSLKVMPSGRYRTGLRFRARTERLSVSAES